MVHPILQLLEELQCEARPSQRGLFEKDTVPVMVAYGGGVDSTAMLIEIVEAGLPLDKVLFADTGSEKPATYAFLAEFGQWLNARGHPLVTVRYEPKDFKHYPPYRTLDENCFTNGTLPSISFGFSSCSQKWKIEPQDRWTRSWQPAVSTWARGGRVIKLIGYDCSPADAKRYALREGHTSDRYVYGYPLRRLGWHRGDCESRIRAAGLEVPPKSACFMCAAMKPHEVELLPTAQLRRIVLLEARAAPRLTNIEGLWRNGVKGTRGGEARPGRITDFIRDRGLLPSAEIDLIVAAAPQALVRWQKEHAHLAPEERPGLAEWLQLFDLTRAGVFDCEAREPFCSAVRDASAPASTPGNRPPPQEL